MHTGIDLIVNIFLLFDVVHVKRFLLRDTILICFHLRIFVGKIENFISKLFNSK